MKSFYFLIAGLFIFFYSPAQDNTETLRKQVQFEQGDIVVSSRGLTSIGTLNRSTIPYQDEICAIYSLDEKLANSVLMLEKGIAMVKFTGKNGAVKKGDYLTSSDIPGTAMKATESGMTIGVALEDSKENQKLLKILVQPLWVHAR